MDRAYCTLDVKCTRCGCSIGKYLHHEFINTTNGKHCFEHNKKSDCIKALKSERKNRRSIVKELVKLSGELVTFDVKIGTEEMTSEPTKPERFANIRAFVDGVYEAHFTTLADETKDLLAAHDKAVKIMEMHDFHLADAHDWLRKYGPIQGK